MATADKTNQELLRENALLKAKLKDLEQEASAVDKTLFIERELNLNLTNALPYGIYRIRVLSELGTDEKQWYRITNAPIQIEFTNNRFCEILKIEHCFYEENPGILIESVYAADKEDFVKKNVEANLKLIPFIWDGRFEIEGDITWVHFESLPYVLDNGDILWTGILYDNNEGKKAEEEIINKNNELKKLNVEKDKLFSIIAHDLKSPFNSIMGFSELLIEKIHDKDIEGIEEFAEIILKSSQKATTLLSNLMDWSQLQTGLMEFYPEKIEVDNLVDDIVYLYEDIANQKEITLSKNISVQKRIAADKAMLSTILRNLVSNAIKFTEPAGKITIAAEVIETELLVSVSDTGVGIPLNTIDKIFCLDENITTSGTQNEQGTGLGLILCKEFIEKHDGKIWVESKVNKGATFYFTIPIMV